jgi:hypothetical protein
VTDASGAGLVRLLADANPAVRLAAARALSGGEEARRALARAALVSLAGELAPAPALIWPDDGRPYTVGELARDALDRAGLRGPPPAGE